ncbi:MAG: ATP-dependent DNA helicase RecG [Candidatus Omnitrophica bacterium]|nr:ATP-dependent DNA helicase RecG [Candidatus Omnitrophota bacterium]
MMQDKSKLLETPVRYFKGVGPKRSEILSGIGIETALDLLYYLPARYEDRSVFTKIKDLKAGEYQTVRGKIVTTGSRASKSGGRVFHAAITDDTGYIQATWFNQPYLADYLKSGSIVVFYGKVERYDRLQIVQPEYEIVKSDETDSLNMGRIVPVYRLTKDITQKYLRTLIHEAVTGYSRSLLETLPTYIVARDKLVDIKFAISNIHFPANFNNLEKAYRRIVFDEFFILQLALALKKNDLVSAPGGGLSHRLSGELTGQLVKSLPFKFTKGQEKAIADIERDMSSGRVMNRLLEGDVGSGKTVVAAYTLALTAENSFQGAVMAPTEVLARQHFIVLSEFLLPLGISVALLVGGMDPKSRAEIYAKIESGNIDVVVGTHAIIENRVRFKKLGLAVIDEQHKFGVTQRSLLKEKGDNPHILVMTATPIPRTLALTVYGDLDISVIQDQPLGRKPILTYWVEESKRAEAYSFVKEEIAKGRQAYIVCPLIDASAQSAKSKAQNVTDMYEKLKTEEFAQFRVGLLHGRMGPKEKDRIMTLFKKGAIDLLISTVVIEVGVDVPNATVMFVENAESFGLAQLHQLRGRIGRGAFESYCILFADPKTEEAAKRLKSIEETLDGFQIAETDLQIRGPGEFFGIRQHGLPEIRFGNILKDFAIMEAARHEAFDLVSRDPKLEEGRHVAMKKSLFVRFKDNINLIKVA